MQGHFLQKLEILELTNPRSFFRRMFVRSVFKSCDNKLLRNALREKCPNTEFFLVRIFPHSDQIRRDTYSVRMWENMDQKKVRISILFTQWMWGDIYSNLHTQVRLTKNWDITIVKTLAKSLLKVTNFV